MGWFWRQVREGRSDYGRFSLPESGFEGTSGRRGCLSLNRTNGEARGGGEGLPGFVYEPGGEFRRRREGRRGNSVKNLIGSEAIPNFSEPNPYKMEENLLNKFWATMAVGRLEIQ